MTSSFKVTKKKKETVGGQSIIFGSESNCWIIKDDKFDIELIGDAFI